MPHVLVAGRIHEAGLALLRSATGFTFDLVDEVSNESYVPPLAKADALVIRTQRLTAAVVETAPGLKIVSRHGVGYDAIDVAALNKRKIPLTIVGDVNSRSVAEHTLMLMLSAARKVIAYDTAARNGNWNYRNTFEAVELDGKNLMLLGFGRIGKAVARLAQAFGMQVSAYDPVVNAKAMEELGVRYLGDMAGGLRQADFVSLHIPAIAGGPLIGAEQLKLMKPDAIIINAARGGLIDEAALDQALRNGTIAGAGLDVFQEEPPPGDHPLLSNGKITISPHSAGLTQECAARMSLMSVRNIIDYFAGKISPALVVNARDIGFSQT